MNESPAESALRQHELGAIERFRDQWQSRSKPNILEFLDRENVRSKLAMLLLIRIDQQERWRRGRPASVESYARRIAAVVEDQELFLDLIASEILLRRKFGPPATPAEYHERFPKYRESIDRIWLLSDLTE